MSYTFHTSPAEHTAVVFISIIKTYFSYGKVDCCHEKNNRHKINRYNLIFHFHSDSKSDFIRFQTTKKIDSSEENNTKYGEKKGTIAQQSLNSV